MQREPRGQCQMSSSSTFFPGGQGLSLNLELTNVARLAGQRGAGVLLSLTPPQRSDGRCVLPYPAFCAYAGGPKLKSLHAYVASTLPTAMPPVLLLSSSVINYLLVIFPHLLLSWLESSADTHLMCHLVKDLGNTRQSAYREPERFS